MRLRILFIAVIIFATNSLKAQNLMEIDTFQEQYVDDFKPSGWIYFKNGELEPGEPYQIYQDATGDTLNQFQLMRQNYDSSTEMTHYHYRQTYKGLNVEATYYKEHAENGYVDYANGKIVDGLNRSAVPKYGRK